MFRFKYNDRVALLLIPSIAILLFIKGKLSVYTTIVFAIISFLLDFFNLPEFYIGSIWIGLFCVDVTVVIGGLHLVQHSLINGVLLLNTAMVLMLVGVWITLQMKWISGLYPQFATVLEKVLISSISYPTTVLFTWVYIAINGIDNSHLFLSFLLYLCYYLFGLPMRSFKIRPSRPVSSHNDLILGRFESAMITLSVSFFPALFYLSIYHRLFWQSTIYPVDFSLILSLSLTYILALVNRGSLWWVSPSTWNSQLQGSSKENNKGISVGGIGQNVIIKGLKFISWLCLVSASTYRVFYYSSTFYYALNLSSRLNSILLLSIIYSLAALLYILINITSNNSKNLNNIEQLFSNTTTTISKKYLLFIQSLVSLSVLSLSLLLLPLYTLPLSILFLISILRFKFNENIIYFIFRLVLITVLLYWFFKNHLLFLNFEFKNDFIHLTLDAYCVLVIMYILILITVLLKWEHREYIQLVSVGLGSILELILHFSNLQWYPSYMLFASTFLLLLINHKYVYPTSKSNLLILCNSLAIAKYLIIFQSFQTFAELLKLTLLVFLIYSNYFMIIIQSTLTTPSTTTTNYTNNFNYFKLFLVIICSLFNPVDIYNDNYHHSHSVILLNSLKLLIFFMAISLPIFIELGFKTLALFLLSSGAFLFLIIPYLSSWTVVNLLLIFMVLYFAIKQRSLLVASQALKTTGSLILAILFGIFVNQNFFPGISLTNQILVVLYHFMLFVLLIYLKYPSNDNGYTFCYSLFFIFNIALYYNLPSHQWKLNSLLLFSTYLLIVSLYLKFKYLNSPANISKQHQHQSQLKPALDSSLITINNISIIVAFLINNFINLYWLNGNELGIFILSPMILLFIVEKSLAKKYLGESHRYFLLVFLISSILFIISLYKLFIQSHSIQLTISEWSRFFSVGSRFFRWWYYFKNGFLLASSLPGVYKLNIYLQKLEKQKQFTWLLLLPMSILSMLFSNLIAIQLLGLLGFLGIVLQKVKNLELQKKSNQIL
ncbi:hypothetical protein DLAC_01347 [Tieghemostelium lacteum]|uniref:Uncharacterized protein n=1 Tax=Tieghemostelium lacteum TaxID=361077 RepID=A0A152A8R4_TIELA|nr:hypothetical protein DLAC_01347 [Tieghemostelium lacteum]|eukprot:KYR02501.1 hypothetical protein DLAC_01347 [Tieghemostelium lacteum]